MSEIVLAVLFIMIAGCFESLMDLLQFRWNEVKIFFGNEKFFNPKISWVNKWKNGDKAQGEKFLFSSTILVGLTDGWHLFKLIRNWNLFTAIAILSNVWIALLLYGLNRLSFYINFKTLQK